MAKAQGKKAAGAGSKSAAKKVVARVKSAAAAAKKKVLPKKAAPAKPAPKKAAPPKAKPAAKPSPKAAAKPAAKKAAKPVQKAVKAAAKTAAKAVKAATKKVAAKVAAPKAPAKAAAPKAAPAAKPAPAAKAAPAAAKPVAAAAKPTAPVAKPAKAELKPKAVKPAPPTPAPVAPNVPAAPKPAPVVEEKKRGRRARPRVISNGAPAASWLSSEKPRPASFIAAPARAEAPSAVAAPPASSDRLIREEDLAHPAVRIVPVRIDVEQGAGRFYVIANPMEVSVRVNEGIEWDFRYIGGADVNVEEIVIEFEKPSPFAQNAFRTRKPGGARPHRQLSGGALAAAAGKRVQYTVRAMNQFKTELANTRVYLNVTA